MLLVRFVDSNVAFSPTALIHQPEVGEARSEGRGDIMQIPFPQVGNDIKRDGNQRNGVGIQQVLGYHLQRGRAVAQSKYINNQKRRVYSSGVSPSVVMMHKRGDI